MKMLEKVQGVFGGAEKYKQIPVLDVSGIEPQKNWRPIDYIEEAHMPRDLMRGVDCQGKPFVAAKLYHKNTFGKPQRSVFVFHQRYADDPDQWGAHTANRFADASRFFSPSQDVLPKRLKQIVTKTDPEYSIDRPKGFPDLREGMTPPANKLERLQRIDAIAKKLNILERQEHAATPVNCQELLYDD